MMKEFAGQRPQKPFRQQGCLRHHPQAGAKNVQTEKRTQSKRYWERRCEKRFQACSKLSLLRRTALSPKMAVPTRTQVDPSSMATSKSCDIPMERTPMSTCGKSRRDSFAQFTEPPKCGRAVSGSSLKGGTVISPRICRCSKSGAARKNLFQLSRVRSQSALRLFPPTLISISTEGFLADFLRGSVQSPRQPQGVDWNPRH